METIRNLKVLYVEDNEFIRTEMMHFLKKRVGKAYSAADAFEGLQQFRLHKPDVIIADILMPEMNGIDMIREIRSVDRNVHVIIITSVDSAGTILEAVDLGIDSYIVKPLDFDELLFKLQKIGSIINSGNEKQGVLDFMENRRVYEGEIKAAFMKQIKEYTGKGPREVVAQMIGDEIKLTVFGAFSVLESNLLKEKKNFEMVKHIRNVVYESLSKKLADMISGCIGVAVEFDKLDVNLSKQIEQIIFKVRQ